MAATGFKVISLAFIQLAHLLASSASAIELCGSAVSDIDGDGWGWENNQSCFIDSNIQTGIQQAGDTAVCNNNADPDGDGWGWENNQSCLIVAVDTYQAEPPSYSPTIAPAPPANSQSTVQANILTNGGTIQLELVTDSTAFDLSTFRIIGFPERGYLENPGNGAVTYTHYTNSGDDALSYTVADYNGNYIPPTTVNLRVGSDYNVQEQPPGPQTNYNAPATDIEPEITYEEPTNSSSQSSSGDWWQPRASDNLKWQLQLQGDLQLVEGVDVYVVDSTASQVSINTAKATGARVKCYISGGSIENWRPDYHEFPASVVGNAYSGWPGEWWLDTRNIEALAPVMRARIDKCAAKGFDALDVDNVNGFQNNTGFNISRQDSINYIRWLANEAHARGLAFSLKNSETLIDDVIDYVDMSQSESCVIHSGTCYNASKMTARNKPVFAVEYQENIGEDQFWNTACATASSYSFSTIYRDLALQPYGIYRSCN